jgi:hypothetical protein
MPARSLHITLFSIQVGNEIVDFQVLEIFSQDFLVGFYGFIDFPIGNQFLGLS